MSRIHRPALTAIGLSAALTAATLLSPETRSAEAAPFKTSFDSSRPLVLAISRDLPQSSVVTAIPGTRFSRFFGESFPEVLPNAQHLTQEHPQINGWSDSYTLPAGVLSDGTRYGEYAWFELHTNDFPVGKSVDDIGIAFPGKDFAVGIRLRRDEKTLRIGYHFDPKGTHTYDRRFALELPYDQNTNELTIGAQHWANFSLVDRFRLNDSDFRIEQEPTDYFAFLPIQGKPS